MLSATRGVTSSYRPTVTRVGTRIVGSWSVTSQSLIVPMIVNFVRSVHREVDRSAQMLEAVRDLTGPNGEATHVPPVEHVDGGQVLGVLVVLPRLVFREGRPGLRREAVHESPHLADCQRGARAASRDDQVPQVPLVLQRGRNRQRASVARPHEVDLAELQRLADTLYF